MGRGSLSCVMPSKLQEVATSKGMDGSGMEDGAGRKYGADGVVSSWMVMDLCVTFLARMRAGPAVKSDGNGDKERQ